MREKVRVKIRGRSTEEEVKVKKAIHHSQYYEAETMHTAAADDLLPKSYER